MSGNINRTAQIAFGEINDDKFKQLKDYNLNNYRQEYGWVSNNSIYAKLGMDYSGIIDNIV